MRSLGCTAAPCSGEGEQLHRHLRVERQRARHHLVEDDAQGIEIARAPSAASPSMYSGAMYPGVPKRCSLKVIVGASTIFAIPKSVSLAKSVPSRGTSSTFSGLRSRWMTPSSCARPSAEAICSATRIARTSSKGPRPERRLERLALDVFHHEKHQAAVFAEVGDLDDVRVVDPVDGARLAKKPLPVRHVHPQILAQDLDRAEPLDHHVPREVDHGHPSAPQAPQQPIARRQRPADEGVGVARERRAVEGAEARVVGVRLGAPRAELHRPTRLGVGRETEDAEIRRAHVGRDRDVALEERVVRARARPVAHPHASRERDEPGRPLLEEVHAGPVRDADALLEAPEEAPPVAQRLRQRRVEVAAGLQRRQRDLGLGRPHARVVAVTHLQPLRGELDVDDPAAADLEVVARRRPVEPLVPELPLHPRAQVVQALGVGRAALVGGLAGHGDDARAELAVPRATRALRSACRSQSSARSLW